LKTRLAQQNRDQLTEVETPFFVFREAALRTRCSIIRSLADELDIQVLFPLKPLTLWPLLAFIGREVDGFSASSLFEARIAHAVIPGGSVHLVSPMIRETEIEELVDLCDTIVFNSIPQWQRLKNDVKAQVECGLRINPELSLVSDRRYDACRKPSKLGVPVGVLGNLIESDRRMLREISGLHFHNNCDSTDFSQLLRTIRALNRTVGRFLDAVQWINIGGGYLFDSDGNFDAFRSAIDQLRARRSLSVLMEPGASFVRDAGNLVASVVDMFSYDGRSIAVLDTTVNHLPEVFEYQFEPDVAEHKDHGSNRYILAGCSCLAGDVFGEYAFEKPLSIGSRVTFQNMGAYSLVKANMFNGINLPSIYALDEQGELALIREFTFDDFAGRCGADAYKHANF
jgi:carboxynorspermidine decarboxylase